MAGVQEHTIVVEAGTTATTKDMFLPTSGPALLFEVNADVVGQLVIMLKNGAGAVLYKPQIRVVDTAQTYSLRIIRGGTERVSYSYIQSDIATAGTVNVTIRSLSATDTVTIQASDGVLTSTDGALNVNIVNTESTSSVPTPVHGQTAGADVLPLLVDAAGRSQVGLYSATGTPLKMDYRGRPEVIACGNREVPLRTDLNGRIETVLFGSANRIVRTDSDGKLVVVLDANTLSVDISFGEAFTLYGSAGFPIKTDHNGTTYVILTDPSGQALKVVEHGLKITGGQTYQSNHIDVSGPTCVVNRPAKLQSLHATNLNSSVIVYLKLYDTAGVPAPNTLRPVATYPLFPHQHEHFEWGLGLHFNRGIGMLSTYGIEDSDSMYCSHDCVAHLAYVL